MMSLGKSGCVGVAGTRRLLCELGKFGQRQQRIPGSVQGCRYMGAASGARWGWSVSCPPKCSCRLVQSLGLAPIVGPARDAASFFCAARTSFAPCG